MVFALVGNGASTPVAHTPEVSVNSRPWVWNELSVYWPAAAQFPAEGHDTELSTTSGIVPALAGSGASTPIPHTPAVSVNSKPSGSPELSK